MRSSSPSSIMPRYLLGMSLRMDPARCQASRTDRARAWYAFRMLTISANRQGERARASARDVAC